MPSRGAGTVTKAAGAIGRAARRLIPGDSAAPQSRVAIPIPGSTVPLGTPVLVSGTAQDFDGGTVEKVEVSFDAGLTWQEAAGTDKWTYQWTPEFAGAVAIQTRAIDSSGNTELPIPGHVVTAVQEFGQPPSAGAAGSPSYQDTTIADFGAGSPGQCVVVEDGADGSVTLRPARNEEFSGSALPDDWERGVWTAGGAVTVSGGQLRADGARANTIAQHYAPRPADFQATFAAAPKQIVGFAAVDLNLPPWAVFCTNDRGDKLVARTHTGGLLGRSETVLGASYIGSPHHYRIGWTAAKVDYYIDDNLVASHVFAITNQMRLVISDFAVGEPAVTVDWLRMSPYAEQCTFDSRIFDAGKIVSWSKVDSDSRVPLGTTLVMEGRGGNTPTPDRHWSAFVPGPTFSLLARYTQYRATLSTTDRIKSPELLVATLQVQP